MKGEKYDITLWNLYSIHIFFWIHISKANIFTNKISMEHNISFKKLNGSAHTISNNLVYLADIDTID